MRQKVYKNCNQTKMENQTKGQYSRLLKHTQMTPITFKNFFKGILVMLCCAIYQLMSVLQNIIFVKIQYDLKQFQCLKTPCTFHETSTHTHLHTVVTSY